MSHQGKSVSPWQSILAGGAAGGAESLITYPTEYLKTRQQLHKVVGAERPSLLQLIVGTIKNHGVKFLYTGSMAFCLSNASKSAVRFFAFDTARQWLPTNASGKITPVGNMCAGMIAGVAESILVVTPGETLKTKIIDDQAGPRRYTSASHAIRSVVATEGLTGLYRGVLPVTLKQSANAMVRFTSYNFFSSQLQALSSSGDKGRPAGNTALAGAMAGVVTVYATMPFDTLKTRLQALDARKYYNGTIGCLLSVLRNEGVAALWRGTTPRLARLSISGALSFTIYETVLKWTYSFQSSASSFAC